MVFPSKNDESPPPHPPPKKKKNMKKEGHPISITRRHSSYGLNLTSWEKPNAAAAARWLRLLEALWLQPLLRPHLRLVGQHRHAQGASPAVGVGELRGPGLRPRTDSGLRPKSGGGGHEPKEKWPFHGILCYGCGRRGCDGGSGPLNGFLTCQDPEMKG